MRARLLTIAACMSRLKYFRNTASSLLAATVTSRPLECAHLLGTLLRDLGPDYVMWGTDSALWGNPQWQIEAFRKFQIPDQLVEGHGYPKLTDEIKAKVFGLNAARRWSSRSGTTEKMTASRSASRWLAMAAARWVLPQPGGPASSSHPSGASANARPRSTMRR